MILRRGTIAIMGVHLQQVQAGSSRELIRQEVAMLVLGFLNMFYGLDLDRHRYGIEFSFLKL